MSELTEDQKRSIEINDQKDLSRDNHAGTELQGETFRERIAGLKDTVKEKASDLIETTSEKASDLKDTLKEKASDLKDTVSATTSDLKNSIQETASNLDKKKAVYVIAAGLAVGGFHVTDNTAIPGSPPPIAASDRGDPQVHIEAPVKAPDMPPAADTTDERLAELASSMKEVNEGVETGQESQTETGQLYTEPGQET